MKKILIPILLISLCLFGLGYSQTFQVLKDGVNVYQFTCPTSPAPPAPPVPPPAPPTPPPPAPPTPPPAGSIIVPWTWSLHVEPAGPIGSKRVYVIRVPAGTTAANASFYTYDLKSNFNITFTCPPGVKWYGRSSISGGIQYSGNFNADLHKDSITPWNGFVPPGDYIVELIWNDSGPVMINTGKR